MNVIILAGGYAERLQPLTKEYPKTLLRIAGKPTLYHLLENLSHIAYLDSITIATDENKKQFFTDVLDEINILSKIRPNMSYHSLNNDGTIKGPLKKIFEVLDRFEESFTASEDFLVIGGDNVFGFDLNKFTSFYLKCGKSCNAVQQSGKFGDVSQFGVPTMDTEGRVTSFLEKPQTDRYKVISTACYIFNKEDIHRVEAYLAKGTRDALGEFMRSLVTRTEIVGYKFPEDWYDIGTREGIIAANGFLMDWKPSNTKEPEHVFGSTEIIPPVYVETSAIIQDSTIGPNVYIGAGSKILQSNLQNSIVYDRCILQRCNLRDSVIGSDSSLEGRVSEAVVGPRKLFVNEIK